MSELKKKIAIGADHGGFELKGIIASHLRSLGFDVIDVGTDSDESCDYPIFASRLCDVILRGDSELGILVCGTGIGMSIAANKHRGIRAACCSDTFSARLTRMHNNSNVLCIGARVVGSGLALDLVDAFIGAGFEGGRHTERLSLIDRIECGERL